MSACLRLRHFAARPAALALLALAVTATLSSAEAQDPGPKPRLELADSARRAPRHSATADGGPNSAPRSAATAPATPAPARVAGVAAGYRADFVRNQTALGVALYAPAFATTIAHDPLAWAAGYLLVAGGSYVTAAEISRGTVVTDPMQRLATGLPIRGAIAGALLASMAGGDSRATAGAVLFGSIGGTTAALTRGKTMDGGEAAATLFGSDVLGLTAFGLSTATGLVGPGSQSRLRLGLSLGGMIAGTAAGQAYAALAPYTVSVGDLYAMSALGGVGMLAGFTFIAGGAQTEREIGAAGTIGGLAGLLVGDRLLARRYDHTPGQGQLMMAGGIAGGLMGSGVALLTRAQNERWSTYSAALATVGAAAGVAWTQYYVRPSGDRSTRLGALRLNPLGVVAAATGARGAHTIGNIRF